MTPVGALVWLALISCLAVSCGDVGTEKAGGPGQQPSHHGPRGFRNPHLPDRGRTGDFFRWRLGLGPEEKPAWPPGEVPSYRPRVVSPDLARLKNPDPRSLQVTWIGHATFLIQAGGLNILTDPMFSERASPVSFAGPKRLLPPGVPFQELPHLDAVVISHNHYDHLDTATVQRLGPGPRFFVPLGLGAWFQDLGLKNVQEMDWWQSAALGPVRFVSVPAQHFSQRTPFNHNQSLWCGWVLQTPGGSVFFAGDTGYSPDFREIGARLGPPRLSLIPIGGYQPRWFMRTMHLNPPEAVRVHRDLGSRQSIGMHWGTFRLTDEPLGEPPLYLEKALRDAGLPCEEFITLGLGETRSFP